MVLNYLCGLVKNYHNQRRVEPIGDIKENILKSMFSYAGSRGMIIFNKSDATAFMTSSTYLKAGG